MSMTRYEAESADLLFRGILRFHPIFRLSGYVTFAVRLHKVFYVTWFSGISRNTSIKVFQVAFSRNRPCCLSTAFLEFPLDLRRRKRWRYEMLYLGQGARRNRAIRLVQLQLWSGLGHFSFLRRSPNPAGPYFAYFGVFLRCYKKYSSLNRLVFFFLR